FFSVYHAHHDLTSFPTRRSSDLEDPRTRRQVVGSNLSDDFDAITLLEADIGDDHVWLQVLDRLDGFVFGFGVTDNIKVAERTQRSEEHTSELQSRSDLVCRLLLD